MGWLTGSRVKERKGGRAEEGGRAWLVKDGKVCPAESTEFYFEMPLKCIYKRKLIAILASAWLG